MAYSPALMRWLQEDPLGYVDGANAYSFLRDNVLGGLDPYGMAVGHHIVVQEIWRDLPESPGRKLWDRLSTGKLPGGHHWDAAHAEYSTAVKELFCQWKEGKNLAKLSEQEAMEFFTVVMKSSDRRVATYLGMIRRQLGVQLEKVVAIAAEKAIAAQAVKKGARLTAQQFVKYGLKTMKVPLIMAVFTVLDIRERGVAYAAKNAVIPIDAFDEGMKVIAAEVSGWVDDAHTVNMEKKMGAAADVDPRMWDELGGFDADDFKRGSNPPLDTHD